MEQYPSASSARDRWIIDAGVEHFHIRRYESTDGGCSFTTIDDGVLRNDDRIARLIERNKLFSAIGESARAELDPAIFVSGKLAEVVVRTLGKGRVVLVPAALWSAAKDLLSREEPAMSLGIVDLSASGYMAIAIEKGGRLIDDLLVTNPKCGAGSGINLSRILEKLAIEPERVDRVLVDYLGEKGQNKRKEVAIRADRCGVFSSSATISDKNQGIPLDHALAVTMKSEVMKACRKMAVVDVVYLSGRVFSWRFARECAEDHFLAAGVKKVVYDRDQEVLLCGVERLTKTADHSENAPIRKPERRNGINRVPLPSLKKVKDELGQKNLFFREDSPIPAPIYPENILLLPIDIALDIGSTMAKMVVGDALSGAPLLFDSLDNHGDTIATVKHIFLELKKNWSNRLLVQHIGITGSGRYQVEKALNGIYPEMRGRVFTLVENYAHARGSIDEIRSQIRSLAGRGVSIDSKFAVLVDIGGEDTKITIVTVEKGDLFDNAMNIKCSAGTGSLIDTLKSMFSIPSIGVACAMAMEAEQAFVINATCAVFLMENARKMQAEGVPVEEILASCNYAIVENMARTLWKQMDFPEHPLIVLHGQTMQSDPLPLTVAWRMGQYLGHEIHAFVPGHPGHRACFGLLRSIPGEKKQVVKTGALDLDRFTLREFSKKLFVCRGVACGDLAAACTRTRVVSRTEGGLLSMSLGGCSAINERESQRSIEVEIEIESVSQIPDYYRGIWSSHDNLLKKSDSPSRLIVPRCFSLSEYADFFGAFFADLSVSVHCDNVREGDILEAQPLFRIDTCAPNIGTTGQFLRLARENHGIILVPQIDYLPTDGQSLGRTCTTNQGGVIIAKHFAEARYPAARFFLLPFSFKKMTVDFIADQLAYALGQVFSFYGLTVTRSRLEQAVQVGLNEHDRVRQAIAGKAAEYVEEAIERKLNIAIVCAREYLLSPGIYDSHVGKLLRDKNVCALPAYAFPSTLDKRHSGIYWRNPHDLISKIEAITRGNFHEIILDDRLKRSIRQIEKGLTSTRISVVQVSTFRCGPDTVTLPTAAELTKHVPSLLIQSDAMIKELAHLENRVNTHLHQLENDLYKEIDDEQAKPFDVRVLDEFLFEGIVPDSDVVYFPTLADNRMMTAVLRAAGITAIDNYDPLHYDLEEKVKRGRSFAGEGVCLPLSAVYADVMAAVEDFIARKEKDDPLVSGKKRVLIFMNGGDGPCRLGQYPQILKLLLYQRFRSQFAVREPGDFQVKIMVNMTSSLSGKNVSAELEKWTGLQGFQAIVLQGVLHSLYFKAGVRVRSGDEFERFLIEFEQLKLQLYDLIERNAKPSKIARKIVASIEAYLPKLGGIAGYFGYGLYNNIGMRRILRGFARRWIDGRVLKPTLSVHVEGEVYVRVAQVEEVFRALLDSLGFGNFELDYSPVWSFLEYILENRILVAEETNERRKYSASMTDDSLERNTLASEITINRSTIASMRKTVGNLRSILAAPLYKAALLDMPEPLNKVLNRAKQVLPSLKPHGELGPYLGEAITKIDHGCKLFLNLAPEGCMVSSMGEILGSAIVSATAKSGATIQSLFSHDGEVNVEQLELALIKTLGPEKFHKFNN